MALTEPTNGTHPSTNLICPRCSASLPSQAIFCGVCGVRIKNKKNEEREVFTGNRDEDVHERELDDTCSIPVLSQARLQPYQSIKNNEAPGQISTSSSPPQIVETPTSEELTVLPIPVSSNDNEEQTVVPLAQPLEQQIVGPPSIVDMPRQQIVNMLIHHPSSLARLLMRAVLGNSLLRNSIYITGTGVATSVFGFFFWILATHLYTAYDVGLGSALISAMTLASILANLGMSGTLVQILPRREAGYAWSLTLNACFATGIVASLFSGIIALVALPLFSNQFAIIQNNTSYALAFVAAVPLMTVSTLLDQAFIAERAAHNMLIRNLAVAVLKIPLMVLPVVLMIEVGAMGIFASGVVAMAIALIGALLLLLPRLRRAYCLAVRGIVRQVHSMLSSLTGNYFINLGGLAAGYLLPIFVAIRLTPADNAYYYTTTRVGDFILMGSAAVATSLFAEGSHAPGDMPSKVRSSAKIISLILGPGILISFLAAPYILSIFGPSYAQHGTAVLRIEAISSVPDAITSIYVSVLRVQNRLRFAALLNVGMGALMLALSWVLLPVLGIIAVPIGVFIAETAGCVATGIDIIRARH